MSYFLQGFSSSFSSSGEQYIQNQFSQHQQSFERSLRDDNLTSWINIRKAQAVRNIDFWEQKFKSHRDALSDIVDTLKGREGK